MLSIVLKTETISFPFCRRKKCYGFLFFQDHDLWLPLKDAAVIWFVALMPIFSREIVLETPEFSKAV
jgi:hypothetical protein